MFPVNKSDVDGMPRATIFFDNKKRAIMKAFHIKNVSEEMLYANFYENVDISEGRFPLIMFSMGYKSYVESNTYLLCNLASHGYIVASVGHAYEGVDKAKAKKHKWRIPEKTLLGIAFLGGGVGAFLGMKIFHHKTKHTLFRILVPVAIVLHIIIILLLVYRIGI